MSLNRYGEIIRSERDLFKTPNIVAYCGEGVVDISCENFRKSKEGIEYFLFYKFANDFYLPIWFEFRSINNNLLYLFEEYQVDSFDLLQRILNSSLQKEEGMQSEMKAIILHVKEKPKCCHLLCKFFVEDKYRIDVVL